MQGMKSHSVKGQSDTDEFFQTYIHSFIYPSNSDWAPNWAQGIAVIKTIVCYLGSEFSSGILTSNYKHNFKQNYKKW